MVLSPKELLVQLGDRKTGKQIHLVPRGHGKTGHEQSRRWQGGLGGLGKESGKKAFLVERSEQRLEMGEFAEGGWGNGACAEKTWRGGRRWLRTACPWFSMGFGLLFGGHGEPPSF